MKKVIILICLCLSSQLIATPALNVISINILYGGLKTPNRNTPSVDRPELNPTHKVGGFSFGLGLARYFPENWMRLPDNLFFGLEADYSNYADNTYGFNNEIRNTYKTNSLSALGILKYVFDNHFFLLGKAGVARVTQTLESYGSKTPLSKFRPQIQLGGGYRFNKHFEANAAYNYISGSDIKIGNNKDIGTISNLNLGLSLLF